MNLDQAIEEQIRQLERRIKNLERAIDLLKKLFIQKIKTEIKNNARQDGQNSVN